MVKAQSAVKLRKHDVCLLEKIFNKIREGCSLYGACRAYDMSTQEFYHLIALDDKLRESFLMALSDYADQCTDDIRALAENLKVGEIDNSTAKLLIETTKWLAQKACPEPLAAIDTEGDGQKISEIEIKFVS